MKPNSIAEINVRHQHFVERYKTGQVNRMRPFIIRIENDIRRELLKTQTVRSRLVMTAKLKKIEELTVVILGEYTQDLTEQMILFAESEAQFGAKTLNKFSSAFDAIVPATSRLFAAANLRPFQNRILKDVLKRFAADQARAIRNAVSMGFFESKTTDAIVRDIIGTSTLNFTDGALNVTRLSASRMARTALNHISSVAKDILYQENSDIITHYEWVSVLDARTSTICQGLDGRTYRVGKGKLPPAHYNCRSTTAGILIDDMTIVNRKAVINNEKKRVTYNEFLSRQTVSFQNEALGTTRAKLFRKGGLSVDKFTDRKNAPLTLDELKLKHPIVWEKSDIGG